MKKPLISIVIPAYNEAMNITSTYKSLVAHLPAKHNFAYEIIIINDGSQDETYEVCRKLNAKEITTRYIEFSRNFGKESATSAGLKLSDGDAVIMIDADGQYPVELIKDFIYKWKEGYQVVVGVRRANSGEGFVKRYGSKAFYKILNILTDGNTIPNSTDYRLIDRQVIDEFNRLTERGRITRGLIDWLGFKRGYIEFTARERVNGKATYNFQKLTKLAMHAFVSQSTKPLQAVGFLGIIVMFASFFCGLALFIEKYLLNDPLNLAVTGTAILAVFLSFLIGIVLVCQGMLALYIESIHNETQNRPLYIISKQTTTKA